MSLFKTQYKKISNGISLCVFLTLVFLSPQKPLYADSIGLLLLSKDNPTYHKVSDLTVTLFKDRCSLPDCSNITFKKNNDSIGSDNVKFAISYGTIAANLISKHKGESPVIRTMLPKQIRLADSQSNNKREFLNLYIDQPVSRYFQLTKIILPRADRVGLIAHRSNIFLENELHKTASNFNLNLEIVFIDDDKIGKALSNIIRDIDALIALPDSRIHNSKTIPNILTTAYRNKIPVIGFSSAYTKAGAVASVYTSLDDIAKETAEAALELINFNKLPAQRQSSKYFSIAVNHEVASSLGLNISSVEKITNIMKSSALE